MMTPLREKLRRQIELTGPITIANYVGQCLFDPQYGYYTTREPFGASGDFVTAPEISQMFGEMLAVWWLSAEANLGLSNLALVEIGPGRGTLMDDMLRTIMKLTQGSLPDVHMIEVSARLAALQKAKLASHAAKISWYSSIEFLPEQPLGIIANELFDAIPAHQYVKTRTGWFERTVRLQSDGKLGFALGPARLDISLLPEGHEGEPEGQVFEYAPARHAMMQRIAQHLHRFGGFALCIDYGHAKSGLGDTLQAVMKHKYDGVLDHPGQADLTSHVDFAAIANTARAEGVFVTGIMEQGRFLRELGIMERAQTLRTNASGATASEIDQALKRLVSDGQMGRLFKVLGLCSEPRDLLPLKIQH